MIALRNRAGNAQGEGGKSIRSAPYGDGIADDSRPAPGEFGGLFVEPHFGDEATEAAIAFAPPTFDGPKFCC
jgi:hypothetical protein